MNETEKQRLVDTGKYLPVMEEFYTIQGEGAYTGTAAYFVRIGGCDIGCHWCDVKESWDPSIHPVKEVDVVVENASKYSDTVVVTGGEPLTWDMSHITKSFRDKGIKTHIETSGTYPFSGHWDWVCLSPKKLKEVHETVYPHANELKVIVYNDADFEFAEQYAKKMPKNCKLYLQAEWSRKEKMTPKITDYVMNHPQWKISIQTHKYLNIP